MIVDDTMVYVRDGHKTGFAFNTDGKFLFEVGQAGKGPGEHFEFRDMSLDETTNTLHVLDYQKILKYDSQDGQYLGSKQLNIPTKSGFNVSFFQHSGGADYYLWSTNPDVKEPTNGEHHYMYKYVGDSIQKKFFKYEHNSIHSDQFFGHGNNEIFIAPLLGDNYIYQLSPDSIQKVLRLDFEGGSLPQGYLKQHKIDFKEYYKLDCFISISDLWHTDNIIYFTCDGPNKSQYEGFINRTDNKEVFAIRDWHSGYVCYADKDYFYMVLCAEVLADVLSNKLPQTSFHQLALKYKLEIEDNPIIFQFKLKEGLFK